MATTFPRQHARTHRFSLGAPRAFSVAPDGSRVVFLRSRHGTDLANLLWVREVPPGEPDLGQQRAAREYIAADPASLLAGAVEELPAEERARRERSREGTAGIVGYATDGAVELAAFSLSGRLFTAELRAGTARELPVPGPVVDPRPAPDGRRVAYVAQGGLRVVDADGTADRALATPESNDVSYGLAEFIAAEEMSRHRGYWWSPDSRRLLVARVDDSPVERWWISDPANPGSAPTPTAYPAAGTPNAEVTLHLVAADGSGSPGEVSWDRERYPYLARVHWSAGGPPLLLVQSRDQRSQLCLSVDTETGETSVLRTEEDPHWLELFAGVPAWTPDGRLLHIEDRDGARRLTVDGEPLSPRTLHVRGVLDVGERDVLFSASSAGDVDRAAVGESGVHLAPLRRRLDEGEADEGDDGASGDDRLRPTDGARTGVGERERPRATVPPTARVAEPGGLHGPHIASAVRGGPTLLLTTAALDRPGARAAVLRAEGDDWEESGAEGDPAGTDAGPAATVRTRLLDVIPSYAETPVLSTSPRLLHTGSREIPAAVVLPTGFREEDGPLPVLMDPYGGPHAARAVAAHNAHLTAQWFADQGFAVVAADGRGTPGYSPEWEKSISRTVAEAVLEDQVDAVRSLAERFPLDLDRVAIRGWSFGGYLAALAVLRRPDVFHAAVAGAPVTDWRLYDTHYTERYCGTPQQDPESYARVSLITDEGLSGAAPGPRRPLMLIQGLADDNVVAAHTLRLSSALLAEGRPHEVLPLSGVTHMTPQEEVHENLLLLQVDFLQRALGLERRDTGTNFTRT